jgi:hypothetical protein
VVGRSKVMVTDSAGVGVAELSEAFYEGACVHAPIVVEAGGSVTVRVQRMGAANAVVSGLFLGDAPAP